jgi:ribokinase
MKVLNFGSLNIDYTYSVPHIIVGGETMASLALNEYCGGKGLNQSIALARAGLDVWHAGTIGYDGDMLTEACERAGIHAELIRKLDVRSGHTVIQVDEKGQNSIILYGGTNMMQDAEYVDEVLSHFDAGDCLVLQNEINMLDYIIDRACEKGMKIVMNPSPYNDRLAACDLGKVSLFFVNEIEAAQITGDSDPDHALEALHAVYPNAAFVLTLGSEGAWYYDGEQKVFQGIFKVKAVDTTAAGDTFTGFFLRKLIDGAPIQTALLTAAKASSIAVTRSGAAPSIPSMQEVEEGLAKA